ncbi:mavicyanin-like [Diospyros lotus]|uniref:mavicyanin-like n=1 Tax=Diospyros lotus TaxID=55363 RepID=UPI00225119CA|nr:mavicyanin-like [Diospyros lotus]
MALAVEGKASMLVLLAAIFASLQVCIASVYTVGDSAGWTSIANVDYKQWAATKTFQVGDVIYFQYNPQFHNVMQVSHAEYRSCNSSSPMASHTTGNDSITITRHGHHFFLCGVPGHCQAGQKVDISVPRTSSLAPTATAAASPSAHSTDAAAPASSPSSAAPSPTLMGRLQQLGLSMALLAAFA